MVQDSSEREVSTTSLGEMIMGELKNLDKVAYVRVRLRLPGFQGCPGVYERTQGTFEKPGVTVYFEFQEQPGHAATWTPSVDVCERPDAVVILSRCLESTDPICK
jgi:hypothetical protein